MFVRVIRNPQPWFPFPALVIVGCTGKVGGNEGPGAPATVDYAMVRLTNTQYLNSVHDLFPAAAFDDPPLPNENILSGFSNISSAQSVTALVVSDYQGAAAAVASAVRGQLSSVLPCQPAVVAEEEACAKSFIADLTRRAYRRPIRDEEAARLYSFFQAQRASGDFSSAITDVVEVLLQSPAFLYRLEAGQGDATAGAVALTSHEVASRLSYFLTNSMPDGELMQAADGDALHMNRMMNYVIAGSGGGNIATGRYLSMPRTTAPAASAASYPTVGIPHNNLFVSLANLMGLSDVTTFGDPRVCTGPLSQLSG